MRSISFSRPFGSLSARRITLFASALLVAIFAVVSAQTAPTFAQTTTNTTAIVYSGDSYIPLTPIPGDDPTYHSSACGRRAIAYVHVIDEGGAHVICSDNFRTEPIQFVWFPNATAQDGEVSSFGDITEDEKDIIIAIQNRYEREGLPEKPADAGEPKNPEVEIPSSVQNNEAAYTALYQKFTANIRDQDRIELSSIEYDFIPGEEVGATNQTACDSRFTHGLGWIICPVTNWLAAGMDSLYNVLESFLTVTPLSTDREGFLYYIWGVMRNIANILFIAGFLVIIYSQITGTGISSYGIKKSLPRLLIAAILVNISYWISAIAVDLSNFLGVSLHDLFTSVVKSVPDSQKSDFNYSEVTFEAVAGVALSGGTAAAGVLGAAAGVLSTAGGSLWLLLVGLMGVLVSALVAILVMAARQALIIILIVLSPLAFVAYLLPSTEGYFNKWRGLFTTMLMVFPAFSVIFGGAQLAGLTIMYSADPTSGNYFNLIILGMIVQVMPVVITPLLIKLSGSLLGRIAGMVNDPNRGMIDRTRKFAENRRDMTKNRQIYDFDKKNNRLKNNNPLAVAARWNALREIDSAQKKKSWEGTADALYAGDSRSHEIHAQSEISSRRKSIGENEAKRDFARETANREALQLLDATSRTIKDEAAEAEKKNETFYLAMQTKPGLTNAAIRDLANRAQEVAYEAKKEANRQASLGGVLSDAYHTEMLENEEWQRYAGAAEVDKFGALRIKTVAQSEMITASSKRIENYQKRFGFENTDPDIILGKATGAIRVDDEEEQRAAIAWVGKSNNSLAVIEMSEKLDLTTATESIRQDFADAVKNSAAKPIYTTNGKLGYDIPQGKSPEGDPLPTPDRLVDEWMIDATIKHKYDTAALATKASKDEINRLYKALVTNRGMERLSPEAKKMLTADIKRAFQDEEMYRQLGDKLKPLQSIGSELGLRGSDFEPDPSIKKT